MVTKIHKWMSEDGKLFDTDEDAKCHEFAVRVQKLAHEAHVVTTRDTYQMLVWLFDNRDDFDLVYTPTDNPVIGVGND